MGVIEVNHLTKDYGFNRGVFDISFSISKGEVFGFLGPNGAGKSTTIRHLLGFSSPQKGETKIFGKNTFTHYHEILDKVGYIPGEVALPQGLTGNEFLKMMQDMQGIRNENRLNKLLDIFEVTPEILRGDTKRISFGDKRKLAIVAAFMSDPEVLILDEPTSGLDPMMQEVFIKLIREEKERGKTILLSSHIFSEVDATCDRIAIIKDGVIVSEVVAKDLKHASLKFFIIHLKTTEDFNRFIQDVKMVKEIKLLDYEKAKNEVFISCDDQNINVLIDFLGGFPIVDFINHKETLEDYFMKFYREDKDFGDLF